MIEHSRSKHKITVIGAGLAGLTAALRLHQQGHDVEVYEARHRVGGRVFTAKQKNNQNTFSLIELGAQNITDGGESVHFLKLAKEFSLEIESREIKTLSFLVYQDGQYKPFSELLSEFCRSIDNTDAAVDEAAKECTSMLQLLDKLFANYLLLKMAIQTRMVAYEGVEINQQSLYHNIDTLKSILKGGIAAVHPSEKILFKQIKNGNAQLPLKIAELLGDKIHTNKALKQVLSENQRIKLFFNDGTYTYCDQLVLAIPASVYNDIQFDPTIIPPEKIRQISNIAYGANYKICIPIQNIIHTKHSGVIADQYLSFLNQDEKIMIMYCIHQLEQLSQKIDVIQHHISTFKSSTDIISTLEDIQFAEYENIIMHDWKADQYAKGSYAGYSTKLNNIFDVVINYKEIPIKKIFLPIDDRVFFIGEHTTILDTIGTMEAAIESAERMVKIIRFEK